MPARHRGHPATALTTLLWALLLLCGCDAGDDEGREALETSAETPATAEPQRPPGEATSDPNEPPTTGSSEPTPLDPQLVPVFQAIRQRQTGPARAHLEQHLQQHPEDGQASFLLGLAYHQEHRYALARPHYERAMEKAPGYHATYYFHAWALYYLGEPDLARAAFEHHLSYQPDEGDSHFGIGLIDLEEGRIDEAERRFNRSIELQREQSHRGPERSKAHARLADIYMQRGEIERARDALILSTQLDPNNYGAFYKLFRAHTRLGETEAAERAHDVYVATRRRLHPQTSFPE